MKQMLKNLVTLSLILLAFTVGLFAQAPTNGYPPKVFSNGNWYNRVRADSAQHVPHKYGLTQNTTDSTPQIFAWSTPTGDSLVLFVNGRYIIYSHTGGSADSIRNKRVDTSGMVASNGYLYYDQPSDTYKFRAITMANVLAALGYAPLAPTDTASFVQSRYQSDTARARQDADIARLKTSFLGAIYSNNSWSSLTGFTNVGATVSAVSNALQFSGGANNFSQTLQIPRPTAIEHWNVTAKITMGTAGGTSYGPGLGVKSTNTTTGVDAVGVFDMTNTATAGKIKLYAGSTLVATSVSAVSFSAGDAVLFSVERKVDSLIGYAQNLTTGTARITVKYAYILSTGTTTLMPNTGNFSIFSVGGTFSVDSLAVGSKEIVNAPVMVIGDSKSDYYERNKFYRFGNYLGDNFKNTLINAGSGDKIVEALTRIPEIRSLRPLQILVNIGRNDIASTDSATVKTRYTLLIDSLLTITPYVYHLLPFYETTLDQQWFVNWINRTYSAAYIIDTYTPTKKCPNCLFDGIHLNDNGQSLVAGTIINSFKLTGAQNATIAGLADILAYADSANAKMTLGAARIQGSPADATFMERKINLTGNYPAMTFNTNASSNGGASFVFKTAAAGMKLNSGLFGDSAAAALVVQMFPNVQQFAFFLPDSLNNTAYPFLIRQAASDFNGARRRITAEAGYNLFGGTLLNATGTSFGTTQATFAVNALNIPIDLYNLPTSAKDTTTYKPLARGSDGKTYMFPSWVTGVTAVGAFSTTATANALDISGVTITAHAADGSNPGMLKGSGSQTIAPILTMPAPLLTGLTGSGTNDSSLTADPSNGQVHKRAVSGTYSPTTTNTLNITSGGTNSVRWTREGSVIHLVIAGTLTPTASAANTTITFSLPFNTSTTTGLAVGSGSVQPNSGGTTYVSGLAFIGSSTTVDFKFYYTGPLATSPFCITLDYDL